MIYWTFVCNRLQHLCIGRAQYLFVPKRWKKNKRKFTKPGIYKKTDPNVLAMRYFDETYRPHYGDLWPIIRLGLLSRHKYGALINNYTGAATPDSIHISRLKNFGAVDIIEEAAAEVHSQFLHDSDDVKEEEKRQQALDRVSPGISEMKKVAVQLNQDHNRDDPSSTPYPSDDSNFNQKEEIELERTTSEEMEEAKESETSEGKSDDEKKWWEDQFIIAPGYEAKMESLLQHGGITGSETHTLTGRAPDIDIISVPIPINSNLKCYVHQDEGNVKPFPRVKSDPTTGLLTYYAMDASSILPVLALDLQPDQTVLDLCAAPGGKAVAIMQTMCVDGLLANEPSKSRRQRLNGVISSYLPKSLMDSGALSVSNEDGCELGDMEPMSYDKVLVDVPCTSDRQSALATTNNIFTPYRTKERKDLPKLQRDLLCAALQAVKPGGDVVYSTCTLSQLQNDDVVENAIYMCRSQLKIKVAVVDLSPLTSALSGVFHFWKNCSYGQLVLPGLRRNFGPMYFCRLQRIK